MKTQTPFQARKGAGLRAAASTLLLALTLALPAAAQSPKGVVAYKAVYNRALDDVELTKADIAKARQLKACAGQDAEIRATSNVLTNDVSDLYNIEDELSGFGWPQPTYGDVEAARAAAIAERSELSSLLSTRCGGSYVGVENLPPATRMTLDEEKPSYGGGATTSKKTTLPGTPAPKVGACPRGTVRTYVGTEYRCVPP